MAGFVWAKKCFWAHCGVSERGFRGRLGAGAEVGAVNGVGNTALHIAATNGREEVCRALMAGEGGAVGGAAAVTVKNKEGKTAVECAKNDAIKQIFGAS